MQCFQQNSVKDILQISTFIDKDYKVIENTVLFFKVVTAIKDIEREIERGNFMMPNLS